MILTKLSQFDSKSKNMIKHKILTPTQTPTPTSTPIPTKIKMKKLKICYL